MSWKTNRSSLIAALKERVCELEDTLAHTTEHSHVVGNFIHQWMLKYVNRHDKMFTRDEVVETLKEIQHLVD